jgi:hypothetical protein
MMHSTAWLATQILTAFHCRYIPAVTAKLGLSEDENLSSPKGTMLLLRPYRDAIGCSGSGSGRSQHRRSCSDDVVTKP